MDTSVTEVLKSEEQARKITADAQLEAGRIVAEAKREAGEILMQGEAANRVKRESRIAQLRERLEKEKRERLDEQQKETAALVNKARKNLEKAVGFVTEHIRNEKHA